MRMLVRKPIQLGTRYKTKGGLKAWIITVNSPDSTYPVIALIDNRRIYRYDVYGDFIAGSDFECDQDLIEDLSSDITDDDRLVVKMKVFEALKVATMNLVTLCEQVGTFSNGVTDPSGTMDEGAHIAGLYLDNARQALKDLEGTK